MLSRTTYVSQHTSEVSIAGRVHRSTHTKVPARSRRFQNGLVQEKLLTHLPSFVLLHTDLQKNRPLHCHVSPASAFSAPIAHICPRQRTLPASPWIGQCSAILSGSLSIFYIFSSQTQFFRQDSHVERGTTTAHDRLYMQQV